MEAFYSYLILEHAGDPQNTSIASRTVSSTRFVRYSKIFCHDTWYIPGTYLRWCLFAWERQHCNTAVVLNLVNATYVSRVLSTCYNYNSRSAIVLLLIGDFVRMERTPEALTGDNGVYSPASARTFR